MKRSQHACDVADRRSLDPPLGQRTRRFAFKIDNDVILSSVENLAKMIVAMDAGPFRGDFSQKQSTEAIQDFISEIQNLQRIVENSASEGTEVASQQLKYFSRMVAHRLIQRSLIQNGKRFRCKIRIFRIRSQGNVQFSRALSQQFDILEIMVP